jgi:predicted RNA-binding Zn-ribbon protein involved in translation (DUF1610 family)
MSNRYVAAGARKSDWDLVLLTDPVLREIVELEHLEFSVFPCSECGEDMVMETHTARDADARGWPKVCLACICRAKNIPYPDRNLPPLA